MMTLCGFRCMDLTFVISLNRYKKNQNHLNVELMLINIRQKALAPRLMPLFVPL